MVTVGRTIRLVSRVICVIVILWFIVFAVDQTKSASGHQQQQLRGQSASEEREEEAAQLAREKNKSGAHKALDETAEALMSPFESIATGSSEWLKNGELLLAALLVYGFGFGYLARMLRAP
jgi:flagellar biosynthesis/type III secretory pathway M-ring protein FliF/YscJ